VLQSVIKNFAVCGVYVILRAVYGEVEEFWGFTHFDPTKMFLFMWLMTVFCWISVRCCGVDHLFFGLLLCSRPPNVPLRKTMFFWCLILFCFCLASFRGIFEKFRVVLPRSLPSPQVYTVLYSFSHNLSWTFSQVCSKFAKRTSQFHAKLCFELTNFNVWNLWNLNRQTS